MATIERFKMSTPERRRRVFSKAFKVKKVKEIEQKKVTIAQVSRAYEVSKASIHRWINEYGSANEKIERVIVEEKSDTALLLQYEKKIAELERLVGQKQVLIDFQAKMIELAEKEYRIDIKKKSQD